MRRYIDLEHALRRGAVAAARDALGDPAAFPNVNDPYTNTPLLSLALAWAPFAAIEELLAAGADPNFEALDGFPALVAVILSDRDDALPVLEGLLDAGADVARRGLNDWTPLHAAAARDRPDAIELLLARGADAVARTTIDDLETPLDLARACGHARAVAALESALPLA
jgi:ankyrin repeat protein